MRFNKRTDKYGGSLENRARFLLECYRSYSQQYTKRYATVYANCSTGWLFGKLYNWKLDLHPPGYFANKGSNFILSMAQLITRTIWLAGIRHSKSIGNVNWFWNYISLKLTLVWTLWPLFDKINHLLFVWLHLFYHLFLIKIRKPPKTCRSKRFPWTSFTQPLLLGNLGITPVNSISFYLLLKYFLSNKKNASYPEEKVLPLARVNGTVDN